MYKHWNSTSRRGNCVLNYNGILGSVCYLFKRIYKPTVCDVLGRFIDTPIDQVCKSIYLIDFCARSLLLFLFLFFE